MSDGAERQGTAGAPLRLGLIGFGVRGTEIAKAVAATTTAQIVAVADLYAGRRARATELLGADVFTTADYRQLLARRDVPALAIATPDHWHAPLALAALQAGKDVYCESPVVHGEQDPQPLLEAARDRVFQVGGALESAASYQKARALMASGAVGHVTAVRATWDTGSALDAWQRPFPPDASPDTVDFETFLGAAPRRPFDLHRFFRWPCYWDYGSGLAGARLVPLLTAIHTLAGVRQPIRAVLSGGTWRWKDGRDVPDALVASFDYEQGLTATLAVTQNGRAARELHVMGTEGTLVVTDEAVSVLPASDAEPYASLGETWPKDYRNWFYMMHGLTPQGAPRREFPGRAGEVLAAPDASGGLAAHLADFVTCVGSRQQPREPLQAGVDAAAAVARAGTAPGQGARPAR